jgi:hypothetical protein
MRQTIDLNGTWDFVADLDPRYHDTPGYIRTFVSPGSNRRHWRKEPLRNNLYTLAGASM